MKGLESEYPQQFELMAFEEAASCELGFSQNPDIGALNSRILGNDDLPPVEERLPQEPLVVAPYQTIGSYGGVLTGLSKATEAGTSDLLSVRHVNFARYADDLQTVVPNIAKAWEWNDDYTELTITLRRGHKWSDGAPFTAEDVAFWHNDLILNPDVYPKTPDRWVFAGSPATVEARDEVTVVFTLPVPTPGLLNRFAVDYGQPVQPKHFLGQFMAKYNPDAEALASEHGFESAAQAVDFYYGGSDWKDVPSPLLKDAAKAERMGRAVVPTLESHILVEESAEGRKLVANPYFFMVDTAGNQLPYISEIHESDVDLGPVWLADPGATHPLPATGHQARGLRGGGPPGRCQAPLDQPIPTGRRGDGAAAQGRGALHLLSHRRGTRHPGSGGEFWGGQGQDLGPGGGIRVGEVHLHQGVDGAAARHGHPGGRDPDPLHRQGRAHGGH